MITLIVLLTVASPQAAIAHAGDQGFVLLLPTGLYTAAGVFSVIATVVLVALLPQGAAQRLFSTAALLPVRRGPVPWRLSLLSALLLAGLIWIGLTGPHNPRANGLPLAIWAVFWVGIVLAHGLFGNLWRWINPWSGPAHLLRRMTGRRAPLRLPVGLAYWPAVLSLSAFALLLLAYPAPADPERLAGFAGGYWLVHMAGAALFGPRWLRRAEGLGLLMACYARCAPFGLWGGWLRVGLPGWKLLRRRPPGLSVALFMVFVLAIGSFDGLNETFWWFGLIGVNPLEFPGRSEVVGATVTGVAIAVAALPAIFAVTVWLGLAATGGGADRPGFVRAFRQFAPSLLPIALGYHFGHYLPGALVDIQYVALWLNDPLAQGANLLGLQDFHVTTGFFNTKATVRVIWLSQAGGIVLGHVFAILLAHALAGRLFPRRRAALVSQLPVTVFMVAYTLFGLWLLASPRGV